MTSTSNGQGADLAKGNGYLYAILNLPKEASAAEINERHRALSLTFHPDKQQDEELKTAATKEFLEIQKAYQVLSDPFLRQVYDMLGPEGLTIKWPPEIRSRSKDEIHSILEENRFALTRRSMTRDILPKSKIMCSINATSIFSGSFVLPRVFAQQLSYSAERRVNDKTSISFEARSGLQGLRGSFQYLGTIRHQFSPRVVSSATINFLYPYSTKLEVGYEDTDNSLTVTTGVVPTTFPAMPLTSVSFSRKLFRQSHQRGQLNLQIGTQPSVAFFYKSPTMFHAVEEGSSIPNSQLFSTHGLRFIVFERNIGLVFETILPKFVAETVLTFTELSTRLKASIHYGLTGIMLTLGSHWSNDKAEVGASLVVDATGVLLELDFAYLDQRLSLPIVLSTRFSPALTLGTVVVPTSLALAGYQFIVLPRRRARRRAQLRAALKSFEEDSDARKERAAVEFLMKDSTKRQVRLESAREGLIIREATYGVLDSEETNPSVTLSVTTALQALVRNSQLHIPGGESKAALQGFSDPAPFAVKTLCIRYSFRGRNHYAEIADSFPVVLPLEGYLITQSDK